MSTKTKTNAVVQLYAGDNNTISEPVTSDSEKGAWVICKQSKSLTLVRPETETQFQSSIGMLLHYLDGDFAGWTPDVHYPRSGIQVEGEFVLDTDSDLLTTSVAALKGQVIDTIRLGDHGLWYEQYQGKVLGVASKERARYHNLVNVLLRGDSLGVRVLGFHRLAYARAIVGTLQAEPGTIRQVRAEKIKAAEVRDAVYFSQKPFVDNNLQEAVGLEPSTGKRLMVPEYQTGRMVNAYDLDAGTRALVWDAAGASHHTLTWDPANPLYVEAWELVKAYGVLSVQFK